MDRELKLGAGNLQLRYTGDEPGTNLLCKDKVFLDRIQLSASSAKPAVADIEDPKWGSGQRLEFTYPNGDRDRVTVYESLPFVFFQPVFANNGDKRRNIPTARPFSAFLKAGVDPARCKAWGTAGITAVDGHPGSYVFLALADPDTRQGVVAASLS